MGWRLARSLESLRSQVNALAPGRSKTSDGTIGDTAHSARLSDHNPDNDGVVRAMDLTDDPRGGLDALWLREALRESRDSRIKYLISEGQIANARRVGTYPAWAWRPYTGTNGHFQHLHISVQPGALGDTPGAWRLTRDFGAPVRPSPAPEPTPTPEVFLMALSDDQQHELLTKVRALFGEQVPWLKGKVGEIDSRTDWMDDRVGGLWQQAGRPMYAGRDVEHPAVTAIRTHLAVALTDVGAPVTDDQLDAAIRRVLGSLDN